MAGITLTNLVGYIMGVPTDEVSINIQKLTVKASTEKIEVKDRVGRVIGRADWNLKQEYTIEGYIDGTTGVLSTAMGGILTVAGIVALGGFGATGACLLDDIQTDYETGTLAKLNYKVTRYADIPLAATQTIL